MKEFLTLAGLLAIPCWFVGGLGFMLMKPLPLPQDDAPAPRRAWWAWWWVPVVSIPFVVPVVVHPAESASAVLGLFAVLLGWGAKKRKKKRKRRPGR